MALPKSKEPRYKMADLHPSYKITIHDRGEWRLHKIVDSKDAMMRELTELIRVYGSDRVTVDHTWPKLPEPKEEGPMRRLRHRATAADPISNDDPIYIRARAQAAAAIPPPPDWQGDPWPKLDPCEGAVLVAAYQILGWIPLSVVCDLAGDWLTDPSVEVEARARIRGLVGMNLLSVSDNDTFALTRPFGLSVAKALADAARPPLPNEKE